MFQQRQQQQPHFSHKWVTLGSATLFLLRHPKLLLVSSALVVSMGLLTWLVASETLGLIDSLTGHFFTNAPDVQGFWSHPAHWGWVVLHWLFLITSRVIAFYLAFLLAYCLTSPGYVLLSFLAGNRFTGKARAGEAAMTFTGFAVDLWEGIKIGMVGILATTLAFIVNFIPIIGQALAFLVYTYYSALMFIDFPASRYRWHLGQKVGWVFRNTRASFLLGVLPAAITMIPVLNIFLMALLFPVFTVHTTLNYLIIEERYS